MATWNTDKPAVANQVTDDVADIEENFQELHDVVEQLTNGTLGTTEPANFKVQLSTASRIVATDASKDLTVAGCTTTELETLTDTSDADSLHTHDLKADLSQYENMYIPANQFIPTASIGCAALSTSELANNLIIEFLSFDGSTQEFACCSLPMPEDYDLGTIKAKFFYVPSNGCSAGDIVTWAFDCIAIADDEAIAGSPATVQSVDDTITAGVENDLHITAATPAITTNYTAGDYLIIKINRDSASGNDDMAEDAKLLGVWIQYKTLTTAVAAW